MLPVFISRGQSTARKLLNDLLAALSPSLQLVIVGLVKAIKSSGGLACGEAHLEMGSHDDDERTFERLTIEISRCSTARSKAAPETRDVSLEEFARAIHLEASCSEDDEGSPLPGAAGNEIEEGSSFARRGAQEAGKQREYEQQVQELQTTQWMRRVSSYHPESNEKQTLPGSRGWCLGWCCRAVPKEVETSTSTGQVEVIISTQRRKAARAKLSSALGRATEIVNQKAVREDGEVGACRLATHAHM